MCSSDLCIVVNIENVFFEIFCTTFLDSLFDHAARTHITVIKTMRAMGSDIDLTLQFVGDFVDCVEHAICSMFRIFECQEGVEPSISDLRGRRFRPLSYWRIKNGCPTRT